MLKRSLHRLTRRLRVASFVPLAWWVWKYRADLRRALPLAKAAPRRILAGEGADVLTEIRVLHVLATQEQARRLTVPGGDSADVAAPTTATPPSGIRVHSLVPDEAFA